MRFSALAICSLFAASASASVLRRQAFPPCSGACFAHPNLGACQSGENECLCKDNTFVTTMFQCIQDACTGVDLANAIADAAGLCAAAGVVLPSASAAEFAATASLSASGASASQTAPAGNSTSAAATGAQSSAPAGSSSTPPPSGARSITANTAFVGLAAIGAIALAL
ncbi:hypothetical protein C8F04DRAFT_1112984 [Mycena alexandri]|uniref:CFEM domain-containing protein n=1 Tax=Mycena alexandri TaxID=1745969 RepID=A0AAD6SQA2_9AGAR|nr:hypothetical protein C8F04DRAFT_1112984 [Mycena alexandri]